MRASYVGIQDMQEGFHSERIETSQSVTEPDLEGHRLDQEFHIKYPVQALLAHFKAIFTEELVARYVGATRSRRCFRAGSCWCG